MVVHAFVQDGLADHLIGFQSAFNPAILSGVGNAGQFMLFRVRLMEHGGQLAQEIIMGGRCSNMRLHGDAFRQSRRQYPDTGCQILVCFDWIGCQRNRMILEGINATSI